jgi:hypothetical protein
MLQIILYGALNYMNRYILKHIGLKPRILWFVFLCLNGVKPFRWTEVCCLKLTVHTVLKL